MAGHVAGNALSDAGTRQRNGWFIGHFVDECALRQSGDVELKWGLHSAGERNDGGFVANRSARTLSILITGRFRLRFQEGGTISTVDLEEPGAYALWLPGVEHDWDALSDCQILTVRWPSIPKDQG